MSTLKATATLLISYYVIIFGGRELMKNIPAFSLNGLFKIHNLYLTVISGCLLALFAEQLIPTIARRGTFYAICDANGGWTDKLVILYYLIGNTSVSWVPITLNLMVHVVMYWYYFQSARGIRIWWKQYITVMQIIQFVVDLGFVYFASYTYFTSTYFPWLPNHGSCAGEEFAAFAGMGILSSYLLLFISFYIATYKKPLQKKGRGRATSALVEMKDEKVPTVGEARRRLSSGSSNLSRADFSATGSSANGSVRRSRKA
ncbi:hypothetical protein LTR04_003132 [Oleoguttula sp. CCFEE 6159]|nr:hypothetical protein LTR04_003132 [Oleoguttula sp. CCFEE 6159]